MNTCTCSRQHNIYKSITILMEWNQPYTGNMKFIKVEPTDRRR